MWRTGLLALVAAVGCTATPTSPAVKAFPVAGKVLLADGTPLQAGRVTFHPRGKGKEAVGEINSDGSFTLTSFQTGDGAVPDDYVVSVKPFSYSTGQPVQVPQAGRVPKKFWEEDTSDLRVTVKPEANQLTLTLR